MPPTGSSWIAVALISASVVHVARGPSPLTVRLIVGHGAGVSGEPRPGRPGAAGTRGRLLDGRLPTGCLETGGDPGQAEGCQPRQHPASRASAGGQAPGTSRRSPPVRSRSPGRSKVQLPSMSAARHAVTLSGTGRHGERAHCRRSARATRSNADGPATVQIRAICASLTHALGSATLCRADERVPGDGVLPVILRPRGPAHVTSGGCAIQCPVVDTGA